jgi:SpoIID/LytB domain protein
VATDRRPRRRLGGVLAACAVGAAALVTPVLTGGVAAAAPGDVQFTGHGYGHGRGLGQWGAYGYAVDRGWTHQQILARYYGGTVQSTQPDGPVTVALSSRDGKDLVVTSGRDFTVGGVAVSAGAAARVQALADGTYVLSTSLGCGSPVVWTTTVPDSRVVPSGDPGSDLRAMLSLCTTPGTVQYRGELSVVWAGGAQHTVNTVRMEDYLRGVVPRESPASWGDAGGGRGIEALEAQAVSARSYAWAEGRLSYARTCDTTACQVYGGAGVNYTALEDARSDRAVAATAGAVLRTASGAVVRTEFSSSTGGYTAGGTFPAVPDDGDSASPYHDWTQTVPAATVGAAFQVGTLTGIAVLERNGLGADGGRVTKVRVTGTSGSVTTTGEDVRTRLGLRSGWFTPTVVPTPPPQTVVYQGSGNTVGASAQAVPFGQPGDVPLSCDWDGDGVDTLAVFRAGTWFLANRPGASVADVSFGYGQAGDQPVCGDWDGDGVDTVGVYRNGQVFLRNSNTTGRADGSFAFGSPGDVLVAGDWNGDRFDTVGVWRRGTFFLANSNLRPVADVVLPYGAATDLPAVGDWDGNGADSVGVYRSGTFYLRDRNTPGPADRVLPFGAPGDRPLTGVWSAGGKQTIGVARGY